MRDGCMIEVVIDMGGSNALFSLSLSLSRLNKDDDSLEPQMLETLLLSYKLNLFELSQKLHALLLGMLIK